MKHIGAFDAKTHFSQILGNVENHKDIYIITKHGHEVAMLIPIEKKKDVSPVKKAIEALKEQRKKVYLGKDLTISQLKNEGRA
jgi:prevent-host-death family protein